MKTTRTIATETLPMREERSNGLHSLRWWSRGVLACFFMLGWTFSSMLFAQQVSPGIDEKLGTRVPLDLRFIDETGQPVSLRSLIQKPTIVALVYYRCPGICPLLLSGTSEVLDKVQLEPGTDFQVLTISFDETDTPELSQQKKRDYLHSLKRPFPEEAWRFLTGDQASIRQFTDAVGFRFQRQGVDFVHPAALIVLAPDGKVTRYLYGTTFLPFDLKMALIEASQGRVGPTISRVLQFCFSYDPEGRSYVFNVTKVAGSVILFCVLVFLLILVIKGQVHRRKASE